MSTLIKICGLRTAEHALAATVAGADMLGFIFAPARRQIAPSEAAAIAAEVRALQQRQPQTHPVVLVGVFVNETSEHMIEVARECQLDVLQLSGDEDVSILAELPLHYGIFKAVRFTNTATEQAWLDTDPSRVRLLAEAHVAGAYGGTGTTTDWKRAAHLAQQREIILAGGLHPNNVAEAIRRVHPWAVDVSSGVETDGVKDSAKIQAFVAAAKAEVRSQESGVRR